jgi:hypothetical protein
MIEAEDPFSPLPEKTAVGTFSRQRLNPDYPKARQVPFCNPGSALGCSGTALVNDPGLPPVHDSETQVFPAGNHPIEISHDPIHTVHVPVKFRGISSGEG